MKKYLSFLIFLVGYIGITNASDLEREKLLADAIKDSIVVGDVVSLKTADTEFIGLLNTETNSRQKGVTLILHGMGSNPNAPQLIHPLRDNLAHYGWSTLAIQLPVLALDAQIDDYIDLIPESTHRIEVSLNYLKENFPNQPCTMVAHSLGAVMAINFLASKANLACDAVVLIGLPTLPSKTDKSSSITLLKKVKIPILDIYGSQDLPSVIQMASVRKTILSKNNPLNRQQEIAGADHLFTGLDETLALSIHSWLTHVTQRH